MKREGALWRFMRHRRGHLIGHDPLAQADHLPTTLLLGRRSQLAHVYLSYAQRHESVRHRFQVLPSRINYEYEMARRTNWCLRCPTAPDPLRPALEAARDERGLTVLLRRFWRLAQCLNLSRGRRSGDGDRHILRSVLSMGLIDHGACLLERHPETLFTARTSKAEHNAVRVD